MNNTKYYLALSFAILLFIGAFFAGKGCCSRPEIIVTQIDSTLKVLVHDTAYVEGVGKIEWRIVNQIDTNYIYIKDSLLYTRIFKGDKVTWDSIPINETNRYILSKPFVSCLDTITNGDTIKACYEYPMNYLSVLYKPKPDSIYEKTIYQLIKKNWYLGVGINIGAGWSGGTGLQGQIGIGIQLGYKIAEF